MLALLDLSATLDTADHMTAARTAGALCWDEGLQHSSNGAFVVNVNDMLSNVAPLPVESHNYRYWLLFFSPRN